ncbi:RCC1/BLIP-II [Aspergillus avenaceus]|uniref:RCC1/BLIP-II n=1 Tax=Aspergillus avenaceus TaxID=36643 RepID=A0A5N6TRT8_ASPAV|nr:RCC1/BLIP-II [Aspergillus avenaceus]
MFLKAHLLSSQVFLLSTATMRVSRGKHDANIQSHIVQNEVPSKILDVYVCGNNNDGELGLGDLTKKAEIPRLVLNTKLDAESVGVVQVSAGGIHSVALTRNNLIMTWGVNDEGALGRITRKMQDNDDTQDEHEEESGEDDVDINVDEATPSPVDPSHFPKGTVFVQVMATNSATFALTRDGLVYGWGTFRGDNGRIGWSPENKDCQQTPVLVPGLTGITKLAAGGQHVLALTSTGAVFSWGCNDQHQLVQHLLPSRCALPLGITDIGAGTYHSFAILKGGFVFSWGSNNFGQTGIATNAGQNNALIEYPTRASSLQTFGKIVLIDGGKDHSIAITEAGHCLAWGRIENKALGIETERMFPWDIIHDDRGRPRILKKPHHVDGISGRVIHAATGSDHSIAITELGHAYTWGFNSLHQTGHTGAEEILRPTIVRSKDIDTKTLVSASTGGQFTIVVGDHAGTKWYLQQQDQTETCPQHNPETKSITV